MGEMTALERVCFAWDAAALAEPVSATVNCRTGIVLAGADEQPRFCYVSAGSPIEQVIPSTTGPAATAPSIRSVDDRALDIAELSGRLVDGEVAAVLAPVDPADRAKLGDLASSSLPADFVERRQAIRFANVQMRFVLRQIGLAEVSSHRGAPPALYQRAHALWSVDLSLCTDPAMMLTLGADRQRYVDPVFEERAIDRLPRALGRLHDLGIRSYPRLVIV